MKQILLVGAGHDFPEGAFTFLKSMHDAEPLSVTGLFFSPIDYNALATASHIPIAAPYLRVREREKEVVRHNKGLFVEKCKSNYIRHHVHKNEEEWDKNILARESRFSDMILLSGELFYSEIASDQPNSFLQTALHGAECPVLIVPEIVKAASSSSHFPVISRSYEFMPMIDWMDGFHLVTRSAIVQARCTSCP